MWYIVFKVIKIYKENGLMVLSRALYANLKAKQRHPTLYLRSYEYYLDLDYETDIKEAYFWSECLKIKYS